MELGPWSVGPCWNLELGLGWVVAWTHKADSSNKPNYSRASGSSISRFHACLANKPTGAAHDIGVPIEICRYSGAMDGNDVFKQTRRQAPPPPRPLCASRSIQTISKMGSGTEEATAVTLPCFQEISQTQRNVVAA